MSSTLKRHIVILEIPQGLGKGPDGFRTDTGYIIRSLEAMGWVGEAVMYSDEKRDVIKRHVLEKADAYIPRVNPGYLPDFRPFYHMLQDLHDQGVTGFSPPSTMLAFGKKTVLENLKHLPFSAGDIRVYADRQSFFDIFPQSLGKGDRVLKRNYGSQGKGVWRVSLASRGTRIPSGDTKIRCTQAIDNLRKEMTLGEFMDSCVTYLDEPQGGLIDMPFFQRIKEGEMRILMLRRTPVFVIHKKPAEGDGAFGANLFSGAEYRYDDPGMWPELIDIFAGNIDAIMDAVNCAELPLIWSADFMLGDKADRKDRYILNELNATCVGFTSHPDFSRSIVEQVIRELSRR